MEVSCLYNLVWSIVRYLFDTKDSRLINTQLTFPGEPLFS